jgi:hypothetical protein
MVLFQMRGTVERVVGEELLSEPKNQPHVYQLMKYVRSNKTLVLTKNL